MNKSDNKKNLRTCPKGHQYYKSSDCPTCPICEQERKPKDGLLSYLNAPARRALEGEGITTVEKLSQYTQKEILSLHGIGKTSIPILEKLLANQNLTFRED